MASTEWETPQHFFDMMNSEFNFTVDVCATEQNKKLSTYISPEQNAFTMPWGDVCWVNPPYDRSIGKWTERAYQESQKGNTVVCLIQGRSTDTIWWHKYVMRSSEIRFIKGRLQFKNNGKLGSGSNISSVVVVFKPFCKGPPTTCSIDNHGKPLE